MDKETEIQKPTLIAIIGIILNLSFYPAILFTFEQLSGTAAEFRSTAAMFNLVLVSIPFTFPVIGSYCMYKADIIAKIYDAESRRYSLLMVISMIHMGILLMLWGLILILALAVDLEGGLAG